MLVILGRIAFFILLSISTALSSSLKESAEDPTLPKATKDKLMKFS